MSRPVAEDPAVADENGKTFSCLGCRQRKIKCDRQAPCSNCVKADTPCSFIPPVRGKRKRTKPPREGLHAKLKRYEEMLKSYGANIEPSLDSDTSDVESAARSDVGIPNHAGPQIEVVPGAPVPDVTTRSRLVTREGGSRYFDSALWSNLGDKFRHPDEYAPDGLLDEASVNECPLFLGSPSSAANTSSLVDHYPSVQVLRKMKDIYVDRIDPLMKILHIPTFCSSLTNALQHPQETPNSLNAAMFSFCLATVSALDDDECQSLLGGPRPLMLARYRTMARQALINAGLLHTSSLTTLRAFSLFLIGVRTSNRHDTQYILSGVAVRLALKMGLHRDGESLGLSLFESEMRRRLWWHIVHIDFRAADMLGMRPCLDLSIGDTKVPLNVEDEDLTPEMVDPPPERDGITSIILCLVRCDIMEVLRKLASPSSNGAYWDVLTSPDITTARKDAVISHMEDHWERKYLRYCDPSNSLHTFASIMIRSCIAKMRLLAHSPRRRLVGRRVKIPQAEREIVFANATKLLEYAVLVRGNRGLQKYTWRISTSYLWDTLLCVLIEARHRKPGPEVDRLWQLIGVVLSQYPEAFKESTGAVYVAMGKWTLEVWDDYVAATKSEGLPEPVAPDYINAIRQSWISRSKPAALDQDFAGSAKLQSAMQDRALPELGTLDCYNFPDLVSFETDPNEWVQWEQLLSEHNGFGQMEDL
ncbi:uncharacterized protein Z520_11209 [Fonsecaea multimorphosa CBS 102226]|uniref:Zn(2)-C6 fungal-type domain-containing protein n=1 Tax=Fonsecaea multimorphosa CBS 102226 TaxID=1442371 RepID=A0A0D2JIX9_9EURO|nr:uncharacterized protein Z520_11209 [Fonsecaea multimorphosa CBS 102226]KIX93152.1 hypothetical protein Z520_11209 [Fonsecaea multimorphosa CBS 102226]OAL18353.1 hypothetical protein AYO22_10769 [Fonsecaea multimorphosa]